MTIRKTNVYQASRLNLYDQKVKSDQPITWAKVESILAAKTRKVPAAGVKAIRAAYDAAKTKAGRNPSTAEINAQLQRARSSLENERAKGRVNDGYVDSNEAANLKSPVAKAVFGFLNSTVSESPRAMASMRATSAQLTTAVKTLEKAVGAAFDAFKKVPDGNYPELIGAMRDAAKKAGLPESARSTLIIATNGATGRGDNGSLTDGGNSIPTEAEVKKALHNALDKLKAADGAQIVDFKNPGKAPVSKRDGVITDLEALRTPTVQGKAVFQLLTYASSL